MWVVSHIIIFAHIPHSTKTSFFFFVHIPHLKHSSGDNSHTFYISFYNTSYIFFVHIPHFFVRNVCKKDLSTCHNVECDAFYIFFFMHSTFFFFMHSTFLFFPRVVYLVDAYLTPYISVVCVMCVKNPIRR